MSNLPFKASTPEGSQIAERLAGAYFYDTWSVKSGEVERSALEHFIAALEKTPRWVDACMTLRNRAVSLVGLKDLGGLSGLQANKSVSSYRPGDRVGIFTLFENTFDEVLMGDKDKHLNVVLSVHRRPLPASNEVLVTVTTVVHVHNTLGRLYMLPVKPMHRRIAPAVLRAIGQTPNAT